MKRVWGPKHLLSKWSALILKYVKKDLWDTSCVNSSTRMAKLLSFLVNLVFQTRFARRLLLITTYPSTSSSQLSHHAMYLSYCTSLNEVNQWYGRNSLSGVKAPPKPNRFSVQRMCEMVFNTNSLWSWTASIACGSVCTMHWVRCWVWILNINVSDTTHPLGRGLCLREPMSERIYLYLMTKSEYMIILTSY